MKYTYKEISDLARILGTLEGLTLEVLLAGNMQEVRNILQPEDDNGLWEEVRAYKNRFEDIAMRKEAFSVCKNMSVDEVVEKIREETKEHT